MGIRAIELDLVACRQHLSAAGGHPPQVGAFLAGYLLIKAYAEFELAVESMVRARGDLIADAELRSFYESSGRPRGLTISELGKFLGRFDTAKREAFVQATEAAGVHVRYNNIIVNRHATAHDHGASVTFADVADWLQDATNVLDAFADGLGVPRPA